MLLRELFLESLVYECLLEASLRQRVVEKLDTPVGNEFEVTLLKVLTALWQVLGAALFRVEGIHLWKALGTMLNDLLIIKILLLNY